MHRTRTLGLLALPLIAIAVAVLALTWNQSSTDKADAASFGAARMDIVISGGTGTCSTAGITDFSTPPKCTLDADQAFDLDLVFTAIPSPGWEGWQTKLVFGDLTYKPTTPASDEFKNAALLPLRSAVPPGQVTHADATGFVPPFPDNTSKGVMLNLAFNCTTSDTLFLRQRGDEYPDGSNMVSNEGSTENIPPELAIDINCGAAPTDTPVPPTDTPTFTPEPTVGETPTPTTVETPGTPTNTPVPSNTPTMTPVTPTSVPPTATNTAVPTNTPVGPSPTPPPACGDVTGNGTIDSLDALWILWFSANLVPSVSHPDAADVNKDGVINPVDAALILQFNAGLLNMLNCK